jgi:hypothetical protein
MLYLNGSAHANVHPGLSGLHTSMGGSWWEWADFDWESPAIVGDREICHGRMSRP